MMQNTDDALLPPSAFHLRKHLYIVLGEMTKWKSKVFVESTTVMYAVIQSAGYDPENLSQYGNPEDGWRFWGGHSDCKSFNRRIWSAFRRGYWLKETPWTLCGPKRGLWGLTEMGVCHARELAHLEQIGNTTAQFLNRRLEETGGLKGPFWKKLQGAVASKFKISREVGIVDDHIQTGILRLIRRDSLRERIESGQPISDSHIATYVVRSAINDCRDAAINPVTRELLGARTVKERQNIQTAPICSSQPAQVTWDAESGCWDDIVNPTPVDAPDNRIDCSLALDRLNDIVKSHHPEDYTDYVRFIHLRAEGHTLQDILGIMDVPRERVRELMDYSKSCIQMIQENGLLDDLLPYKPSRRRTKFEPVRLSA